MPDQRHPPRRRKPSARANPSATAPADAPFTVLIQDNFHAQIRDDPWPLGQYATYAQAEDAAARHVQRTLQDLAKPDMSARDLLEHYATFADAPYISPPPQAGKRFSAQVHAYNIVDAVLQACRDAAKPSEVPSCAP